VKHGDHSYFGYCFSGYHAKHVGQSILICSISGGLLTRAGYFKLGWGFQGVMGSIPWQGMVFFTLWLQLKGLSNVAAAGVHAMLLTGSAFGGALGGYLGDRASLVSPSHGRIIISQISVATGVPLSFLIIKVLPLSSTLRLSEKPYETQSRVPHHQGFAPFIYLTAIRETL
jgi:hypothetical protein